MRFIHTADWHLGNKMCDINRSHEQEEFLAWLKDQIVEKKAQTLVVAGDIFDTANPPVESRKQYIKFLASLIDTDCKNVIITGGNHDSGALLDSEKDVLELLNIHVAGSLGGLKAEDMVFELFDKEGKVNGICGAVPFCRESELRTFIDEEAEDGEFSDKAYSNLYRIVHEKAEELKKGRNIPLITTGHLYAADLEGRLAGAKGEVKCDDGIRSLDVVGKLGSVHAGVFPEGFDYVALGHIHYTTMVAKNPKIRYSGSPFVLGFDEANLPHTVLSVEVEEGKLPEVEKICVPEFIKFRRIIGNCEYIKEELEKLTVEKSEKPLYIEICYKREPGINIHDEIEEILLRLPENVAVVSRKLQEAVMAASGYMDSMDTEELKNLNPEKIFESLIISKSRIETNGRSEEDIEKEKKETVKKYLPLFLQIAEEVNREDSDENN